VKINRYKYVDEKGVCHAEIGERSVKPGRHGGKTMLDEEKRSRGNEKPA